jgi:hypothetical protein
MNVENPSLSTALKTLWGAAEMPFGAGCIQPYRHPAFEELIHRLSQLCEIGASGMIYGRNGVGKSYLCGCFLETLPESDIKSFAWPTPRSPEVTFYGHFAGSWASSRRCAAAIMSQLSTLPLVNWAPAGP